MFISLLPKNKHIHDEKVLFQLDTKKLCVSSDFSFNEVLNSPELWCAYISHKQKHPDLKLSINKKRSLFEILRNHIKGKCLIIIVNKKNETISFARDQIGIQHAYYHANKHECFLSDEIEEVISFIGKHKIEINEKAVELYLTFQYVPSPFTLVKGILQVPLNSYVQYGKDEINQEKLKNQILEHEYQKEDLEENYLLSILNNSIVDQNISSFKSLGAFLSGGMDTTTNISLLVTQFGIKPTVFTAIFEQSTYNELEYAELVAKKFSIEHNIIEIGPESIKQLEDMITAFDNPVADRSALAQYIISEKARETGIDCMISGEGGDEILGYPRNLPEHFVPSDNLSSKDLATLYLSFSSLNQKETIAELLEKKPQEIQTNEYLSVLYESLYTNSSFEKIYYGQWQTWLIDNVLMKDYQLLKHFSLGYIAPFINEKLMSHMVDQSAYKKSALLKNKNYLKASLKEILPQEVIEKKKQKFEVPISNWIRSSLKDYFLEELLDGDSPIYKFIDNKVVKNLFNKHISGEQDNNRPLWALLVLNLWYKSKINKL